MSIELQAKINIDADFKKSTGYAVHLRRRAVRDIEKSDNIEFYLTVSGEVDDKNGNPSKALKDYACVYNKVDERVYTNDIGEVEGDVYAWVTEVRFQNRDVLEWVIDNVKSEVHNVLAGEEIASLDRKKEYSQRRDTLSIGWANSDGRCAYYNVYADRVTVKGNGELEAEISIDVNDSVGRNREDKHFRVPLKYTGHLTQNGIVGDNLYLGLYQLSHAFWKHSDYSYGDDIYDEIKERACNSVEKCLGGV